MQNRFVQMHGCIQSGSPYPWEQEEIPVPNVPACSKSWAPYQNGLGIPRTALVCRLGYSPSQLNHSGGLAVWPPNLTDIGSYDSIIPGLGQGETTADTGTRRMFGHFKFTGSCTPDPYSGTGTATETREHHMFPNGIVDQGTGAIGGSVSDITDSDDTAGFHDPQFLYGADPNSYPYWVATGASTTQAGAHTFTVVRNDNQVFHVTETYTVEWLNPSNAVVATFNCSFELLCDTDDSAFPNYGGAGTLSLMVPGRRYPLSRFQSDYFNVLWTLYQDHGVEHGPFIGGPGSEMGYFAACYADGASFAGSTTYYSGPHLTAASGPEAPNGGFGLFMPVALGHYQPYNCDMMMGIGYTTRTYIGGVTFSQSTFGLDNSFVSSTSYGLNSATWYEPIECEWDGTKTYTTISNIFGAADYERLDLGGNTHCPPPQGEKSPQAMFTAPDMNW